MSTVAAVDLLVDVARVRLLDRRGVREHRGAEVARRGRGVDRAPGSRPCRASAARPSGRCARATARRPRPWSCRRRGACCARIDSRRWPWNRPQSSSRFARAWCARGAWSPVTVRAAPTNSSSIIDGLYVPACSGPRTSRWRAWRPYSPARFASGGCEGPYPGRPRSRRAASPPRRSCRAGRAPRS